MAADGGVEGVEDRSGVQRGLGCAEQRLDLKQVSVAQHGLQRGEAGVGL